MLQNSLEGEKPAHHFPSDTVRNGWRITLPEWCKDQRNQMTGPADDAELCVKMLNSGAPGVMLDLEDSWSTNGRIMKKAWRISSRACAATLSYFDKKRNRTVSIQDNGTVIFTRATRTSSESGGRDRGRIGFGLAVSMWPAFFMASNRRS